MALGLLQYSCVLLASVLLKKSAGFALEGQISTVYKEGVSLLQRLVSQAAAMARRAYAFFFFFFFFLAPHFNNHFKAQELCDSRGGRLGLPVPVRSLWA